MQRVSDCLMQVCIFIMYAFLAYVLFTGFEGASNMLYILKWHH